LTWQNNSAARRLPEDLLRLDIQGFAVAVAAELPESLRQFRRVDAVGFGPAIGVPSRVLTGLFGELFVDVVEQVLKRPSPDKVVPVLFALNKIEFSEAARQRRREPVRD
jgi:hypothetical protein